MDPTRLPAILALALSVCALQNTTQQSSSTEAASGRGHTGSSYGNNAYTGNGYNGLNNYGSKLYADTSQTHGNYDSKNNQGSGYDSGYYKTGYVDMYTNNGGSSQTHDADVNKVPVYKVKSDNTDDYENINQEESNNYDDYDVKISASNNEPAQNDNTYLFNKYNNNDIIYSVNGYNGNGLSNNGIHSYANSNNANAYNGLNYNSKDNKDTSHTALAYQAASSVPVYGRGTQKSTGYQDYSRNSYLSSASSANDYPSTQEDPYFVAYSANYAQPRFHPYKSKKNKDEHKGEVILPPLPPERPRPPAPAPTAAPSSLFAQTVFPATSSGNLVAQGSDSVSQAVLPPPPPSPGSGYNYNPPPPPPPPPPAAGYSYLPPPPSNQYLPVPMSPPPPPPPPPPPEEERQADGFTYYYLGPKLWYIPLLFSIYFVIYVGALIIKAISKHKIQLPQNLYSAAGQVYSRQLLTRDVDVNLDLITDRVVRALAQATGRYLRSRIPLK